MLQGKLSVSFQNGSESRIHHRLKDTLKDVLKSSSDPLNFGFILLRGLKNQFDSRFELRKQESSKTL